MSKQNSSRKIVAAPTSWDWMAYTATIGMQIAFVWELIDMCQKKEMNKLSWVYVSSALIASTLGFLYGWKNGLIPIMVSGVVDILLSLTLFGIKTTSEFDKKDKEEKLETNA